MPSLILYSLLLQFTSPILAATTLFNNQEADVLPLAAPAGCASALGTELSCDSKLHLLYKQVDWAGWNATDLANLCVPACRNSLTSLKTTVASSCGSTAFPLDGKSLDVETVVDFYLYKYDLVCLADGGSWCLMEQDSWFVQNLATVTWPTHTTKVYPDWINDPINGENMLDENGTVIPPYATEIEPSPTWYPSDELKALDYQYNGHDTPTGDLDSNEILEYDEYPLEIQCSPCFLERLKLGFATRWGETYDEVKEQAWANIQLNCGFTEELFVYPTLDQSGPPDPDRWEIEWAAPRNCGRNITLSGQDTDWTTCATFGLEYGVPTSSIADLNRGVDCGKLEDGTYCVPLPCQTTQHGIDGGQTMWQLIQEGGPHDDISEIQFMRWNPAMHYEWIAPYEVYCIGPPGGEYIPPPTTVMPPNPTSFPTTATVPAPAQTPPGTIANCGRYYVVQPGDECNTVAIRFGITFSRLRAMNPSLDATCSNLFAQSAYCVALVDGTTVDGDGDGEGDSDEFISPDGTCGDTSTGNYICPGSGFGDCCSIYGYCGTGADYCATANCASGHCEGSPSPDGTCGAMSTGKYTCAGSEFGECCAWGWCGNREEVCGDPQCETGFGACEGGISPDGTCGAMSVGKYTCSGSQFGECCAWGWCGNQPDVCGNAQCEPAFGTCQGGVSPDGTCGQMSAGQYTCEGSQFGSCCAWGWCGNQANVCGDPQCEPAFGTCYGGPSPDGTCGAMSPGQYTCEGSQYGECCAWGWCGNQANVCGDPQCERASGACHGQGGVSPDGTCGAMSSGKYTCTGSEFGECCAWGWCGNQAAVCGDPQCETGFGSCT